MFHTTLAAPEKGFHDMAVTGDRTINIRYDVDDTKGIINYAGVEYYKICDGYDVSDSNGNIINTKTCNYATDFKPLEWKDLETNNVSVPVNITSQYSYLTVKNFTLDDVEGVHRICLQTRDHADNIHGNGPGTGNQSDVTCKNIFYDKTAPKANKIILNTGEHHWDNDGKINVKMELYDNRAGIDVDDITYAYDDSGVRYSVNDSSIGNKATLTCERSDSPSTGDGSYSCTLEATINANFNKHYNDFQFEVTDKVGNTLEVGNNECIGSYNNSCRIYFDGNPPDIDVEVNAGGDGDVSDSKAHIEYHAKDDPKTPWLTPSGIELVIVSNEDGSNEQVLWDKRNDPNPPKTVDNVIRDYVLNHCPANIKFEVHDKAGNISTVRVENIECNTMNFKEFRVIDVVNPKKYNYTSPYTVQDWIFERNNVTNLDGGYLGPNTPDSSNPYGILPEALAGANMTWDASLIWDGDDDVTIDGYYTVNVYNTSDGYEREWTVRLDESQFRKVGTDGNNIIYEIEPQTFTIPNDAPRSKNNNMTYVTIEVTATLTNYEGEIVKTQTKVFPNNTNSNLLGHIGKVVGHIDDYVYFGERN